MGLDGFSKGRFDMLAVAQEIRDRVSSDLPDCGIAAVSHFLCANVDGVLLLSERPQHLYEVVGESVEVDVELSFCSR